MEDWRLHHPVLGQRDIETAFFKCTRWQLEETLNPGICPYHYYCYSTYAGDYPGFIDILVFAFVAASFLSTVVIFLMEMLPGRRQTEMKQRRRYLLPSGPISLPVMLLILAKGHRINTLFPIMSTGPAILQLIRISALTFESETDSDIRYLILESSTISGAIHAALFLDSVILPYYTGLDALVSSALSGKCTSCICREKALVAGGTMILYRALSVTTALVVCTLCSRISCRLVPEHRGKMLLAKSMLESLSWIAIAAESVYLMTIPTPESALTQMVSFCGVIALLGLHILRRLFPWPAFLNHDKQGSKMYC